MNNKKLNFEGIPDAVATILEKINRLESLLEQKQNTQPQSAQEKILNIHKAAEFLGLSVPTIYSKVSRGELPSMKRENRLYFSSDELLNYLKEGRQKTNLEIEQEAENHLMNKKRRL